MAMDPFIMLVMRSKPVLEVVSNSVMNVFQMSDDLICEVEWIIVKVGFWRFLVSR